MAKATILKTSLDMLYYSGASQALRNIFGGLGAIFMLHHVRPGAAGGRGFAPNAGLEVSPQFLDSVIRLSKERGYQMVSMAEAARRVRSGETGGAPFVAFTLDDGYRDNLVHALPVFRKHNCPFTVFAAPAITDGNCELWWLGLEAVIAGAPRIEAEIDGGVLDLLTATDSQKQNAWQMLYWPVRNMGQHEQRRWIREFCARHGVNLDAICRAEAMTWDELRALAAEPLCTMGAHTVHHYAVARLDEKEAAAELKLGADRLEAELGKRPRFFAYPYGDAGSAAARDFRLVREAGYEAAVTTRKGVLFAGHRDHMTALPRLSLSGDFQKLRYVEVLLSGTAFALWNGFRRLNVA
ncbi:MAG: polysaccharide deacetylase family protein [Aestuariivirga sp.]